MRDVCGVRIFEVSVLLTRAFGAAPAVAARRPADAACRCAPGAVSGRVFAAVPFAKYGIVAARGEYLRRMTAGKIARKLLEQNGMDPAACHVALLGDHMSAELRGALMELALHVRYTMLCAGGGGGEACSVLRREYGVSVARHAGAALLKNSGTGVDLRRRGALRCAGLSLAALRQRTRGRRVRNAAPVVRYSAAPEVEAAMEGIQAQNALLSLLLEMGAVRQ